MGEHLGCGAHSGQQGAELELTGPTVPPVPYRYLGFTSFTRRAAESPHSCRSSPASRSPVGHVGTPTKTGHMFSSSEFRFDVVLLRLDTWIFVFLAIYRGRSVFFTIFVLAGTSTANTFRPLLLQQFLLCSLFTWTVTLWLVCKTHTHNSPTRDCLRHRNALHWHYGENSTWATLLAMSEEILCSPR